MIRKRYLRASPRARAIVPLLLLLQAQTVAAQRGQATATCQAGWDWARTKLNDSPCQVASKLLSLCEASSSSSGGFTLPSGGLYTPSSSSEIKPNTCACNVVMYNLLSACQACQASPSSTTTPELVDWQTYAAACPICSFEGGIVPGPCGSMNSVGFPNSVKPAEGEERIAIPNWAYYNSSGGAWSENGARGTGSGDKVTLSPVAAASPTSTSSRNTDNDSSNRSSSKETEKHEGPAPMGIGMKAAVISCSILAGIIAIVFGTYLFQLCLRQRHSKQLKKFSDESFEKVVPTSLSKTQPQRPKLLAFKNVMSRLTLAPKTPHARSSTNMQPGTPRTPGIPKTPRTPRTAFLRHFPFVPFSPKRETGRTEMPTTPTPLKEYSSSAKPGESRERLLLPEGKLDRLLASAASSRVSVASSYYSDFDSYKPSSSASGAKVGRSNSVNSATASLGTMKTGSVKAKKPIEGGTPSSQYLGVPSAGSSRGSSVRLSETPSIVVSSGETEGDEASQPVKPKAMRIKSQIAQVSRWSDSTGENSGGLGSAAAHSWSRIPSMHSEGRSSTSSTKSKKGGNKSTAASLHQGELTESPTTDLSETLMTPAQQRMTMLDQQEPRLDQEEEAEDLDHRASQASNSSNSSLTSMLRRLDQLDFGDTASNPATPRKVRFSTKSSKSVRVPPSPSGSSVGFAM